MKTRDIKTAFLALLAAFFIMTAEGCDKGPVDGTLPRKLTADYHAVFLDNGQVFFGRLKAPSSDFIELTDVFYVRSETNKETKEVRSVLIKRGQEWHGPDMMFVNSKHVTLIEPVSPGSKVGELIKEAASKGAGTDK
ncbi:MAG: hypothetical protein HYV24_00275 [Deltaproteobacteria bacterium]|nr:hypothetical protein [Deltaproteobacteria bacterium]